MIKTFENSSSNIIKMEFLETTEQLFVTFKGDKVYVYQPVPKEVVTEAFKAESIGKFFHEKIKNEYPNRRIS